MTKAAIHREPAAEAAMAHREPVATKTAAAKAVTTKPASAKAVAAATKPAAMSAPATTVSTTTERHGARRHRRGAQPIIPMPTTPGVSLGWFVGLDGNNFNEPTDSTTTNTGIGVMLETVAAACETPELMLFNPPAQGTNAQQVMNSVASAIGVNPPTFMLGNDTRTSARCGASASRRHRGCATRCGRCAARCARRAS
jgi:hypothetical protein